MTRDAPGAAHAADPFTPSSMKLSDGRSLPVPSRESMAFPGTGTGTTAAVAVGVNGFSIVDISQIVSLEYHVQS
jgi:hypothetical protein